MMDNKRAQISKRVRYIRELNIFVNRVFTTINREGVDSELFFSTLNRAKERLSKIERPTIYSSNISELESLISMILEQSAEDDFDEVKSKIQKEYNLIEKSKRKKSYNRQKEKRGE